MEYFLYIIQVMLQFTPSFNKVCYTLRLQGCFLLIYKTIYYASAGDMSCIYALGSSFISLRKKEKLGLIFFLCTVKGM